MVLYLEVFKYDIKVLLMCVGDFFIYFEVRVIFMFWFVYNIKDKLRLAE